MRALKIVGFAIGGLVALVLLLMIAVWAFVDPNDYKDRIAAGVKSATGRELTLTGDIELDLFPWVALTLGPASLGNPAGFGDEPFATVQRASARVKLLPLLSKRLEVGRVEIEGLDLRLKQNAEGKGNWEFGDDADAPDADDASQPLDLAGVRVADSRISFDELVATDVDIDVGHVAPGVAIPMKARMTLVTEPGAAPMPLSAAFDVTMDLDRNRYGLAGVALEGRMTPEGAKDALPWRFASPKVDLDLEAQTLASTSFEAEFAAAKLGGHVEGRQLIDAPALSGDFSLQPVSLKTLMAQLGIEPPVTRDAAVLGSLSASGRFSYAGDDANGEALDVKLDDSTMKGRFGMNLETGAMTFDLSLDRIDADRYLPPPTEPAAAGDAKSEPFELPVEALKPLKARGTLAIAQAKVVDVHLSNLSVGIDANDGVTRIAPARAQLYGGQYTGEVTIDTRPAQPRLAIDQAMSGVDVAQLMNDFLETKRLSGKGNVAAKLTATGRNSDALIRTLDGNVSMNLADGAVEGVDLWYAIAQAQSLIQKRQLAGGKDTGRTAFDTFKASAIVAKGVATTNDLAIASQLLRVTGKGTSNLATQAIDYKVTATVLKAPPGAAGEDVSGLVLAAIPVDVTGTFDSPKVRPDLEGIAKARVKQEVEKRKDEIEEKVREKVQDKLKNLLRR